MAILGTCKSTKNLGNITVEVNGQIVTVECTRELAPSVNDIVIVEQIGSKWFALARTANSSPTPPEDGVPVPPPVTQTGALTVTPVETRSYRSGSITGWRTDDDDVYQGQYGGYGNHTGCAFYGTKPRSLDGATVTGATVRIRCYQIGSYPPQATTMRLVTQSVRPGGAPTLTSTTAGPALAQGAETIWPVPVAWAQALVDGTAGGIGFFVSSGSPYVRYFGRAQWSAAFSLTLNWKRT